MGTSYKITPALKAAIAKASTLPRHEQDEIARQIMDRLGVHDLEGPWTASRPRFAGLGSRLQAILPKNDVARTITLIFCCFILFVEAPFALAAGIMMFVQVSNQPPSGRPQIQQVAVGGSNQANIQAVHRPITPTTVGQ